jgi:hypothetical protein
MAWVIDCDIIDPDGEVYVTHRFWGDDEGDARQSYEHHLKTCEYFAAAVREGRVEEESYEIPDDERPDYSEEEEEEEEKDDG